MTTSRQLVRLVQLTITRCQNTFGVVSSTSNCTAQLTDQRCFNNRRTCRSQSSYREVDPISYDTNELSFVFVEPSAAPISAYVNATPVSYKKPLPALGGVSMTPSKINILGLSRNESELGRRGSVSIQLRNIPWDNSDDQYASQRGYIATDSTEFWPLIMARYNLIGARVDVISGEIINGQFVRSEIRAFYVDKIDQGAEGVSLSAKDALKLIDGDSSKTWPASTSSFLVTGIDTSATTLTIAGDDPRAYQQGLAGGTTSDAALDGYVYFRIDNEAFAALVSSITQNPDGTYNVPVVRNTTALNKMGDGLASHNANAPVIQMIYARDVHPTGLINSMLFDVRFFDPGLPDGLPSEEPWWLWRPEIYAQIGTALYSGWQIGFVLREPTPVLKVLADIGKAIGALFCWSDTQGTMRLVSLFNIDQAAVDWGEDKNILAGKQAIKDSGVGRVSRVISFYDQIKLGGGDDTANYANVYAVVDPNIEYQEGKIQTVEVKQPMLSAVASAGNLENQAEAVAMLYFRYYSQAPKTFVVQVDAKDGAADLGDIVGIQSRLSISETGAAITSRWIVVSRNQLSPSVVEYELQSYPFNGRYGYYMSDSTPVYTAASDAQKSHGGWYADDTGRLSTSENGYRYQ